MALQGCLALAQPRRDQRSHPAFECSTAATVVRQYVEDVNVRHFKQTEREMCFKLLLRLLQVRQLQPLKFVVH